VAASSWLTCTSFGELGQRAAGLIFAINMWTRVCTPGGVASPSP
jgi:hypothetical protein